MMNGLTAYLVLAGVLSALSVPLYLFFPAGGAEHFGGVPTPTSDSWVTIVAPGDALCAVLSFAGALSSSPSIRLLVVRSVASYGFFHVLAFVAGNYLYVPLAGNSLNTMWISLAVALAAFLYWGVLNPPHDSAASNSGRSQDRLLTAIFCILSLGPGLSAPLYMLVPAGTAEFFGGISTPTVQFWVTVVGPGEVNCSLLAAVGALSSSAEMRRFLIRCVTFYAGFHFLTFLVGNYLYVPLPGNGASMLWVALALDLAVFVYWGVVNPPRSNSSCTVAKQPAQVSEPTKESITECQ